MTPAEIRAQLDDYKIKLRETFEKPDGETLTLSTAAATIALALFTGEIAAQLAELNEQIGKGRLSPIVVQRGSAGGERNSPFEAIFGDKS